MYKCNYCGEAFDQPKATIERHGLDSPPFERVDVCPYCGENSFEEIEEDEDL